MERLSDSSTRGFARHETFHPRYGWFRKAVAAAQQSTDARDLFLAEDATVELGVGKNMVRAIRFWGRAAKLLTDAPNPSRPRVPRTVPTYNGLAVFDEATGFDPFMEVPGTLWLMHWWMLKPRTELPVWWITFNRFTAVEFSEEDLTTFVLKEIETAGWDRPLGSSVRKDVACLLRMYSPSRDSRAGLDDILDCPMRELGLIESAWGDQERYRFLLGSKPSLPGSLVLFMCLDWMSAQSRRSSISLNRLATGIGSPGRVLRIGEGELLELIGQAIDGASDIKISSAAGAPTLSCSHPSEAALAVLKNYYRANGRDVRGVAKLGDDGAAPFAPVSGHLPLASTETTDVMKVLLNYGKTSGRRRS